MKLYKSKVFLNNTDIKLALIQTNYKVLNVIPRKNNSKSRWTTTESILIARSGGEGVTTCGCRFSSGMMKMFWN